MNNLKKLRKLLNYYNLDGYIVPKNDEFFGEYVNKRDDRLNYISFFKGSAGFALILSQKAYLFVDGRYTLQAKKEANKNFKVIEIHKINPQKVLSNIKKKIKIGFDPKLISEASLIRNFKSKNTTLLPLKVNLIDKIWSKRPKEKINKFYILKPKFTGLSYKKKINKVSSLLKKEKVNKLFISSPENLAWLLNIRGKDSEFSPLPNCQAIIDTRKNVTLIVNKNKVDQKFKSYFKKTLNFINSSDIANYLNSLDKSEIFLIDRHSCSFFHKEEIKNRFKCIEKIDPIFLLKSKKNQTEIKNSIKSHIADGVALTKFIYWIKNNINKIKISEISAKNKLEQFRKKNSSYKFPSFNTISGSGPNGAIVHYKVNNESNRIIKKKDIYLCDSGGQYHYGTTDVTRTICFAKQPNKIRNIFTSVLKGHINVAKYNFNNKTTGKELDIVARSPLKKLGLDYAHGTGHGVGYFLNVHEGPQAITKLNNIKLEEGMILSNEPGYYEKNKFGIRIENLVYIKKIKNKLKFSNLTLAPIDKDLINNDLLDNGQKKYLNDYHKNIFFTLSKYLNKNERTWLKTFFN